MTTANLLPVLNLAPEQHDMCSEIVASLSESPRRIPSKYFYDRRGSQLFDAICETPEYYPTRTELGIMEVSAEEIADCIGAGANVMEIGSGSGLKTELLIESLERPASYVPVDISIQHLQDAAERLAQLHPELEVAPVCADFTRTLRFPDEVSVEGRRVVYFPGSTIGNLASEAANELLTNFARIVDVDAVSDGGHGEAAVGGMLLGVDLVKDPTILESAYNDAEGVTAAFNLNVLRHINRELQSEIPLEAFEHEAIFLAEASRIEMRLVATRDVEFEIAGRGFHISRGERIVTEYSHKYEKDALQQRLAACGWNVARTWTDPQQYFALLYCEREGKAVRNQ